MRNSLAMALSSARKRRAFSSGGGYNPASEPDDEDDHLAEASHDPTGPRAELVEEEGGPGDHLFRDTDFLDFSDQPVGDEKAHLERRSRMMARGGMAGKRAFCGGGRY